MKYIFVVFGLIFVGFVLYNAIANKFWDSENALWAIVMFVQYDVEKLREKVK